MACFKHIYEHNFNGNRFILKNNIWFDSLFSYKSKNSYVNDTRQKRYAYRSIYYRHICLSNSNTEKREWRQRRLIVNKNLMANIQNQLPKMI